MSSHGQQTGFSHLRMRGHLRHVLDGRARNRMVVQELEQVVGGVTLDLVFEDLDEFVSVCHTVRIGEKAGVRTQLAEPESLTQPHEDSVAPARDHHTAIGGLKPLIRYDGVHGGAHGARHITRGEVPHHVIRHPPDGGIEECRVQFGTLACRVPGA